MPRYRSLAIMAIFSLFYVAGVAMIAGCGGSNSSTTTVSASPTPSPSATPTPTPGTRVAFSVHWPARSRIVYAPSSALSVQLVLKGAQPGGADFSLTVSRGTDATDHFDSVISDENALPGTYAATVICYAQSGATGSVVATGNAQVTIASDGSGIGVISLTGTIASVALTPNQTVTVGTPTDLAFTCRDAAGNLIVVTPGSAFFVVTSGSNILTVTNGQVQGVQPGTALVQVSVDGFASTSVPVQVTAAAAP